MKSKSIGKNAVLNMIRQGLSVLFPLITYPYAVRVLGPESLGKVNFGQSIVSYFALLAMLGVGNYIIREGARRRENKEEFNEFVNQVYSINILFTIIAYIILIICIQFVPKLGSYGRLIALQSISIALTTFGIDWINTIYEDFLKITVRSIVTYIITIVLLFLFVKDSEDYYIYALLTVITNGIICISNRVTCGKYVKLKFTFKMNLKEHLIPLLILFVNSVAITINTSFDITMLGWIKGDYYAGLYSLPVKVFTVVKNVLYALFIVSLPRLSFYSGNHKKSDYKELCTRIFSYTIIISFPIGVGLFIISEPVVLLMGGSKLIPAIHAMQILSIALVFSVISGIIMNVMNISLRREKENMYATAICAIFNVVTNIFFIPLLNHNGAAITTLVSEVLLASICFVRFKTINLYVNIEVLKRNLRDALFSSLVIIGCGYCIKLFKLDVYLEMILIITISVFVYMIMLIALKNHIILDYCKKIRCKFMR